jgi:hypothetical protein
MAGQSFRGGLTLISLWNPMRVPSGDVAYRFWYLYSLQVHYNTPCPSEGEASRDGIDAINRVIAGCFVWSWDHVIMLFQFGRWNEQGFVKNKPRHTFYKPQHMLYNLPDVLHVYHIPRHMLYKLLRTMHVILNQIETLLPLILHIKHIYLHSHGRF